VFTVGQALWQAVLRLQFMFVTVVVNAHVELRGGAV
jgi:hypothetical protein